MVVRTGGAEDPLGLQKVDFGQPFYASKSFYDAAKNRQVLFGWVKEMVATGAAATPHCMAVPPRYAYMWPQGCGLRV